MTNLDLSQAERLWIYTKLGDEAAADLRERNKLFMAYGPGPEWERAKTQHGWDERKVLREGLLLKLESRS